MNTTRVLAVLLAIPFLAYADLLPPEQDSSSLNGKLTTTTGQAATLRVSATRKGFVLFNVESLADDVQPGDIANARLRIYFPNVVKPGDIAIHEVTQAWSEKGTATEPGLSALPIATFPASTVIAKKFVEVDVTATVRAWRTDPATNFGFAFLATGTTNVIIGAKEGSGSGYPAELEVEIDRSIDDGTIGSGQLALNLTLGGTTTGTFSGTFMGNGAGLTNLTAANISGTITEAQIANGTIGSLKLGSDLVLGGTTSGTFSGNLSGNVTGNLFGNATTATNSDNFTGALVGDVTGTQAATVVTTVGGVTAANLALGANLANAGASANTAGTIVKRDPSGNFSAGTVTAGAFIGDGSSLTGVKTTSFADAPTNVVPALGMVWIKPGTFLMGSPATELGRSNDEDQHWVTLTKGFWIGVHEVTQGEYLTAIGSNPSNFTGDTNRPVEQVTWTNAAAYCTALTTSERNAGRIPANWTYRLPTEAEWEYCCRAGARTTRFGYDDDLNATALNNYAWNASNGGNTTHPVGQKLANSWGLMDMHGNVYEWCQDYYAAYPAGNAIDPQGPPTGVNRVLRGGSWFATPAQSRAARRAADFPGAGIDRGFRVVLASSQP